MLWYLATFSDDDSVVWIHAAGPVPTRCICCGTALEVTDRTAADGRAIELQCDRGHRWLSALEYFERRFGAERG